MNKKNNRKGFTTVELVIVIAVIAILATALIPTFGGLINSANKTANEQEARNFYRDYLAEAPAERANASYFIVIGEGEDQLVYEVVEGVLNTAAEQSLPADEGYTKVTKDTDGKFVTTVVPAP